MSVHGSPGPQAAVLRPNQLALRPKPLYSVRFEPRTHVPSGTIGLVIAKAGKSMPRDRALAPHVECDDFQDGEKFLRDGGYMGRHAAVLTAGHYNINPELFDVVTVETLQINGGYVHGVTSDNLHEVVIPEGATGVVIALEGSSPDDDDDVVGPKIPGHMSFQLPWVFLAGGGRRGAQMETLSHGGKYQINPWFARIVVIPTRDLILEWTKKEKKSVNNLDAALDEIVVNVEGYRLRFEVYQTIRIPARAAPRLVGRFGEQELDRRNDPDSIKPAPVQRFVERVLGSTVEGYFHGLAAEYRVSDLIAGHREVRLELQEQVAQALDEWGVDAVRTTLSEFQFEDPALDELRRSIVGERERRQILQHQRENLDLELDLAQRAAEGRAETDRIQLETDRERRKLEVVVLEEELRLLGRDNVAMSRFMEQLAAMQVPQYIGSDANAILNYLPLSAAQGMIRRSFQAGESPIQAQAIDGLNVEGKLKAGPQLHVDRDGEAPEAMVDAEASVDEDSTRRGRPSPKPR